MTQELGHPGVVASVSETSIAVDVGSKRYRWHPKAVILIAKGSEMMEAILRHQ